MADKYRVTVLRLRPETNEIWDKQFSVSGPAASVEEALAQATSRHRTALRQACVNAPPEQEEPRLPEVKITLNGSSSSGLSIIGMVRQAMRTSDVSPRLVAEYTKECTHPNGGLARSKADDLAHVLAVTRRWVTVK